MSSHISLFSTTASEALAQKVSTELSIPLSHPKRNTFADGESYHQLPPEEVEEKDVIILGSNFNDASHLEIIDLIDGARYWNARSVHVVIPYLGYSTMERVKPHSGEIPKGITRTRQIFRANPDFVAFIDLHSEAVLHAHNGAIQTKHLMTDALVVDKIKSLGIPDIVLVSPDYGRSKWVAGIASQLDVPHTAADKDRFAHDQTLVHQVSSVVRGKTAIICDDMIRTGGSIIQTAQRCRDAGAKDVILLASHLVLAGNAKEKIHAAGISHLIGSDTYPGIEENPQYDLYSVAPLISNALKKHLHFS